MPGMHTISTGCTVAFAIDLYEHGIVSKDELGGLDLTWGNTEAIIELTKALATGKGSGAEIFGDGIKAAVERIGHRAAAKFAMHAGGEEVPMQDPLCFPGLAASYVIDATPGRHTQWSTWLIESNFVSPGLDHPPITDKCDYNGKGSAHFCMSNFGHCVNAAGVCWFATAISRATALPEFITMATGLEFNMDKMQEIGARLAALRMAFNIREGVRNVNINLPSRVLGNPPLESGPSMGITVDNEQQVWDYLREAGWNQTTGCPSGVTLKKLGLDFVSKQIGAMR